MRSFLFATLLATIIIGCQQEPLETLPEQQQQTCRITTGLYYGGSGMLNDSATFTYTADNKLSKVQANDLHVLFTHSGVNITARKFYETVGNRLYRIDTVQYESGQKISKLVSWFYDDPLYWDTARVEYSYQYNTAGKISAIREITILFTPLGNYADTVNNVFTYDAAGNITKLVFADQAMQPLDSVAYTYNAQLNYFSVVHPHFYLMEPFFELHAGFIPHLPYFYSRNNVSAFEIYGGSNYPITYGLDSTNKVTSIDMGGDEHMKYRYHCQ